MVQDNHTIQDQILDYIFGNNHNNKIKNLVIEKSHQISLILSASNNKKNVFDYLTDIKNKDKTKTIVVNGAKIKKILEHNPEYWKTITECKSDNLTQNIDLEFKRHEKNHGSTANLA